MKEKYLKLALSEAKKSLSYGEIPIGAVIVKDDIVIAKAHNTKENKKCSIYHAEINAIIKACKKINNWRLDHCDIYISFEPCPMCASAIRQSRIDNVYSALKNSNIDNTKIVEKIFSCSDINHKVSFYNDLMHETGEKIINDFFCSKRNKKI